MAADANSAVLLSAQRLLTPINAGQTYAINSSDAFQFGRISLRINTLPLFTSVQSLFLILQCSESFILVYYLQQHILQCRSGMFTLRRHLQALISMDIRRGSLYDQQCCPGVCNGKTAKDILKKTWQHKRNEESTGRYTYDLLPAVCNNVTFPSSRKVGVSYCRMLLHDTFLNDDGFRTGISDTS